MVVQINPLKPVDNIKLMDAIHRDASLEYQNRIPTATKAGVQDTVRALQAYRPGWNEFLDALVNRIGSVVARNISWSNPLAEFKRGMLTFGDTIEEIQVGLLEAHVYDPDRDHLERDLFGTERPDVESSFHKVNRQNYYKVTINEALLQRAFLEPQGLSAFVAQLMQAPLTSDNVDEFLLTVQLFSEYESNGGFYHVNVPDVAALNSSPDQARTALRKMRAMADTLKFVSTRYNAAHMPTFAQADELQLFVTPEFNAAVDVEALAGAFNMDKAQLTGRIVPIPAEHFNIDGCQAIMTVKDFFMIADQRLENTSQYNPLGLHNNYFLHHWQVVSASRFVPAVMFHTGADDEVIEVLTPVASVGTLSVSDAEDNIVTSVTRGLLYSVAASAITNPAGGPNDGVRYSITGNTSNRTYITSTGVLHVGGDEGASSLTITATSTWLNPDNLRQDGATATETVTVTGEAVPEWPANGVALSVTILDVVTPIVAGTTAYTVTLPSVFTAADVTVQAEGGINADVTVNNAGTIATVVIDLGVGAPTTYTFTKA